MYSAIPNVTSGHGKQRDIFDSCKGEKILCFCSTIILFLPPSILRFAFPKLLCLLLFADNWLPHFALPSFLFLLSSKSFVPFNPVVPRRKDQILVRRINFSSSKNSVENDRNTSDLSFKIRSLDRGTRIITTWYFFSAV